MKLEEGIIGIILPVFGIVLKVVYDLFQQKLDSTEIIKKRLLKYFIASVCIVLLYFILVYGILNKNFLFKMPQSDNAILLIIFISSMLYFYLNAVISTFVMKHLLADDNSKLSNLFNKITSKIGDNEINKKRSKLMLGSQAIFIILFFSLNYYFIQPKNFVTEDTVVNLNGETFLLPSKTTFKLRSKSNENTDADSKSAYIFKSNDSLFTLPKYSTITLFEETDLKVIELKNNFVPYSNQYGYIDTLWWNKHTMVTLKTELPVTLEKDTTVMILKKDNILQWSFIHSLFLCIGLIIYYSKDFFRKL